MKISNARVYRNGRFERSSVEFSDKISAFDVEGGVDAHGAYLVPGFIDIHTHGAIGYDASDCRADEIPALAGYYAAHGVTSFCFTTMTIGEDALAQAMRNIRGYERQGAQAKCTGVHLEGPFVSYKKRGAQKAENIRMPDLDLFYRMSELSGGKLKIITMAPELDGAVEFIREASKVCAVSLGHTTADYATAMAGFEAGATQATHLFNAMQPLHHGDQIGSDLRRVLRLSLFDEVIQQRLKRLALGSVRNFIGERHKSRPFVVKPVVFVLTGSV